MERKPSARALRHARIAGTVHPLLPAKVFRPGAAVSDEFLSSKRDRRTIRRSVFASRVAASASAASASSAGRVVRRRSKRSREDKARLGNLSALASALDDLTGDDEAAAGAADARPGRVRHRSMKMTKGALKRKERVVRGEMQRFGVSMARLAEVAPAADGPSLQGRADAGVAPAGEAAREPQPAKTADRWAALRGYISSTMEQNPAFANRK